MSACPQNIWNHKNGCICALTTSPAAVPAEEEVPFGSYTTQDSEPEAKFFRDFTPAQRQRAVTTVTDNHPALYDDAYEQATEDAQDRLTNVLDLKGLDVHVELAPIQGRGVGFSGVFDAEGMNHLIFKTDPDAPTPPLVRSYDSSMRAPYVTVENPREAPYLSDGMVSYDWGDSGYDPEPDDGTREKREAYETEMNSYLEDVSYYLAKKANAPVNLDGDTLPNVRNWMRWNGYLPLWMDDFRIDEENSNVNKASSEKRKKGVQGAYNGDIGGQAEANGFEADGTYIKPRSEFDSWGWTDEEYDEAEALGF